MEECVGMQWTFEAETITPLVMGGADPRSDSVLREGLRPPALRGLLRFWFRAIMGGILGDDIKALRKVEGRVFGDTKQRSSFLLRTHPLQEVHAARAYLCMNDRRDLRPHGKNYSRIARPSLSPGSRFLVTLAGFGRCQRWIAPAMSSLWCAALGGVGARSRRGFGSFSLRPFDESTSQTLQSLGLDFEYPDGDLAAISRQLGQQLARVRDILADCAQSDGALTASSQPEAAGFTVLSCQTARLFLLRPRYEAWSGWTETMDGLRDQIYRPFKGWVRVRSIGDARPRWASPLFLQIKRTAGHKYFGLLLAFQDPQGRSARYWGTNWRRLEDFLCSTGCPFDEVVLP